jgi:replicative DNA helicase
MSLERLTPQNLEAEQSLLGSLLLDKDAIIKIGDIVVAEDFYADKHKSIFEGMIDLFRKHEPIDLLSLSNRLQEKDELERIGGRAYLIQLANSVPTASHVLPLRSDRTKKIDASSSAQRGARHHRAWIRAIRGRGRSSR